MKRSLVASVGLLAGGAVVADDLQGVDRLICATAEVVVCVEGAECYKLLPADVDVPAFIVVDIKNKRLSTTKASQENRATSIATLNRADGLIHLQGIDLGRAFSLVINEATGNVTAAVARDGVTVTVFGACTNADVD